ncbi:putative selection and upkeep of intraepithelial T-cells protein 1 homolog [Pteronotus mesoamericanus]|uniref:putative selection and upkeep of intraepithelial T-cells protein 1 homolog n=1 Tax=Pteronotus mesoamericanus TaxID=1884717 RepID=UPI0023EB62E9|nr:putative selection and upkeep of intraepithelial T-cells protein 1 homolog [Pteronotus parnellii mesoamericanus]
MKPKCSFFSGYYVGFLLLQVITSASEKWTVITPTGHLVATVGGQAELSCQLSPPRSAKHMEVSWFKGNHSKLVHLYRDGREVTGNVTPEYMDRIEFVKEAIGDGKVTLRLHNVSISDNGPYQCSFKDSDFRDVASMNLSVAALGLETQIYIEELSTGGLMVECNSGGWFPQPQMEWRDNKGEVVPYSSKSYSLDGAGLFYMKMILFLRSASQSNVICYIHNPLSGEGKQINISLADTLFYPVHILLIVLISILCVIFSLIAVLLGFQCFKITASRCNVIHLLSTSVAQMLCFGVFCIVPSMYMVFRKRVSLPDPVFSVYNDLIWDIIIIIFSMMIYYSIFISGLYVTMRGYKKKIRQICKQQNVDMENTTQEMIHPDQHGSVG